MLALTISIGAEAQKRGKTRKHLQKATVTSKVTMSSKKNINKSNTMRLCDATYPQPSWFLELPRDFKFPANFQQPAAYTLVSTIDTVFNSYLKSIPYDSSQVKLLLPLFIDNTIHCKEFIVSRSMTMDSALQAKYPSLMSFKAFTTTNSLNAARIECDENSVKMMIIYDKKVYYINSVKYNKMNYYVCYAKDDINFVKDKFER